MSTTGRFANPHSCRVAAQAAVSVNEPRQAGKFNACRFVPHQEQVVTLLARVCAVGLETVQIVDAMPLAAS